MKQIFFIPFIFCAFLFNSALFSQKVKFDDDIVLVDKVKKYDFIRTKKGGLTDLSNAILKDLAGNEILILKDTSLYYDKLPHEYKNRVAVFTNYFDAPKLGKVVLVPGIISYNIRKDIVKALEEFGFFKTDLLDEEMFTKLVNKFEARTFEKTRKEIDTINIDRFIVSALIEKTFGPLIERTPDKPQYWSEKIYDGKLEVGRFEPDVSGSYSSIFKIINKKGNNVANLSIIPGDSKASVYSVVPGDEKRRHWIFFKSTYNTPPTKEDIFRYMFEESTKYLLNIGYL